MGGVLRKWMIEQTLRIIAFEHRSREGPQSLLRQKKLQQTGACALGCVNTGPGVE